MERVERADDGGLLREVELHARRKLGVCRLPARLLALARKAVVDVRLLLALEIRPLESRVVADHELEALLDDRLLVREVTELHADLAQALHVREHLGPGVDVYERVVAV